MPDARLLTMYTAFALCLSMIGLIGVAGLSAASASPPSPQDDEDEGAPLSWFMIPEHDKEGDYTGFEDKGQDEPSHGFRRSVDTLFEAQGRSFDHIIEKSSQATRTHRRWELSQINADLAITAEGLLGILALRGEAAIRTFWFKVACDYMHTPPNETYGTQAAGSIRQKPDAPPHAESSGRARGSVDDDEEEEEEADASFDANMSEQELNDKLEQLTTAAAASGVIRDKTRMLDGLKQTITEVSDMMSAVPETAGFAWQPFKFRFAVTVDASGQVLPFMNVGGDLRLRLDWKITPAVTPEDAAAAAQPRPVLGRGRRSAYSMRELVLALSNDLAFVSKRRHSIQPPRFSPSYIEIIIGMEAGGEVAIAQSSLGIRGHLYFASLSKKRPTVAAALALPPSSLKSEETINVIDREPSAGRLAVHKRDKRIKGQRVELGSEKAAGMLYRIDRASFRRGLAKAQKISAFFAERALKCKRKHWVMRQFRTDYEISITGGIGLATLSGQVAVRVLYVDVNN